MIASDIVFFNSKWKLEFDRIDSPEKLRLEIKFNLQIKKPFSKKLTTLVFTDGWRQKYLCTVLNT